jgi:hypothetical protein
MQNSLTLINSTFILGLARAETYHHSSHAGPVLSSHSRTTAVLLQFRRGILGGFTIAIDSRLFSDSTTTVHIDPVATPVRFMGPPLETIGSTDGEIDLVRPRERNSGGEEADDELLAVSVLAGLLCKRRKLTLDQPV